MYQRFIMIPKKLKFPANERLERHSSRVQINTQALPSVNFIEN